jgi:thioredoxin 1
MPDANGKPVEVEDDEFDDFVTGNDVSVIDFWAPWCGPCDRIEPIIEDLAEELAGKAAFGKVNTDENPEAAQRFGVMSIPTIMVFKDGDAVDQLTGVKPKKEIKETVTQHI